MNSNTLNSLPPKTSGFKFFKYKFLIAMLIAVIIALFYWNQARNKLLHRFDELVKTAAEQDLIINYDNVRVHGWPWNVSLEVGHLNVKKQSLMGWQASIPGQLFIKYNFLQHTKIKFHTTDNAIIKFDLPALPAINIAALQGDVSLHNISRDHHIELNDIDFMHEQQPVLHARKLMIASEDVQTEPNSNVMINGYKIEANDLTGQIPFEHIQHIMLKFAIKGEIARGIPVQMVEQWSKSGGAVEISELSMAADKLNVMCAGTLSVDHNLQPLATLTAQLKGIEDTIDDLTARQKITPTMAKIYKMGLAVTLMATTTGHAKNLDDEKNNVLKLSLTIQDNHISIGGVNIYKLPKIDWQSIKFEDAVDVQSH